jgi:hypothetical protein
LNRLKDGRLGFLITHLPEQSVLLFKSTAEFKLAAAMDTMLDAVHGVLNTLDDSVFYLIDIRESHITVTDAMMSMEPVIFGEKAFFRHPKIREILLVTPNPLLRRVTEGVASGLQNDVILLVFEDLDSALAYVEQRLDDNSSLTDSH